MMSRNATLLLALGALSACGSSDGQNPFTVSPDPEIEAEIDEVELLNENETATNNFLFNTGRGFTMNDVQYDAANDQLVINNLPFDGPEGIYDNANNPAVNLAVYESRETTTTGQRKYFAVFVNGDDYEATAAASRSYNGYGFGGANIRRTQDAFNLPAGGEYVYLGTYNAVRTFDGISGLEVVRGDARIEVDILDFDPANDEFGAVEGQITNRQIIGSAGELGEDLPTIILSTASINNIGEILSSNVTTTFNGAVRDSGTYEALLAGENSEEVTGFLEMVGPRFQAQIRVQNVTLNDGTILSAYNSTNFQLIENQINLGINPAAADGGVDDTLLEFPTLPANVASQSVELVDLTSEFTAQEIGVFGADQVIP
ncbi:MAG: hypothetical protein AAGD04_16160 [Pseudomonadota bacterium]